VKKLILLLFVLSTTLCLAQGADIFSSYDPTAARSDLSNVAPATGRDALELGTMAVATATDYVATDTFTGHTDATGASVHGLGTISTKADTDYVATSALALRLDTVNASFTGDIDVVGDVGAATVNGVAPLTAAEKTQALVGSTTVDFQARTLTTSAISAPTGGGSGYWGGTSGGIGFARVTLPAGGIASISTILDTIGVPTGALQRGRITITGFGGVLGTACIYIGGSTNTALEIDDVSTLFSVTKDTPTSTNIYSIGSGNYEIQNTHGSAVIYVFRWEGA